MNQSTLFETWTSSGVQLFWLKTPEHEGSSHEIPPLLSELSEDDKPHFIDLKHAKVRNEKMWSRALLRYALKCFFQTVGGQFTPDDQGKPQLQGANQPAPLFNLSHSHGQIALAICGLHKGISSVGVDLELGIDKAERCAFLAPRVLSDAENRVFVGLKSDQEKIHFFTRVWTGKEAFLKCNGLGITKDLRGIDVLGSSWTDFEETELQSKEEQVGVGKGYHFSWIQKPFLETEIALCFSTNSSQTFESSAFDATLSKAIRSFS